MFAGLRVFKNLSVIRCPLLGGTLTKMITFGTRHFVRYSRLVRYLGCSLFGGFTVLKLLGFTIDRESSISENIQKRSSRGVLLKRCSYKFHKIHRKTPVPESLY